LSLNSGLTKGCVFGAGGGIGGMPGVFWGEALGASGSNTQVAATTRRMNLIIMISIPLPLNERAL
jgi:hypothetical protein